MQNIKQFLHRFFMKTHDFFGFKIGMDFWMVFHWKWPQKVSHSQWKNHPKNETFSEPLKNRFFCVPGALRDSARWPYSFFLVFFIFHRKWLKKEAKIIRGIAAFSPDSPPGYAPKSHRRRFHPFSLMFTGAVRAERSTPNAGVNRVSQLTTSYLSDPFYA